MNSTRGSAASFGILRAGFPSTHFMEDGGPRTLRPRKLIEYHHLITHLLLLNSMRLSQPYSLRPEAPLHSKQLLLTLTLAHRPTSHRNHAEPLRTCPDNRRQRD